MQRTLPVLALVIAAAAGLASADDQKTSQATGELATFEFGPGSARLDLSGDGTAVTAVLAWLRANPDGLVVLDGHANDPVPARANLTLSFARAKAVRTALVLAGVDPDHLVVAAFGRAGPPSLRERKVVAWGTLRR